jgi:hypothetical protein
MKIATNNGTATRTTQMSRQITNEKLNTYSELSQPKFNYNEIGVRWDQKEFQESSDGGWRHTVLFVCSPVAPHVSQRIRSGPWSAVLSSSAASLSGDASFSARAGASSEVLLLDPPSDGVDSPHAHGFGTPSLSNSGVRESCP